MTAHLYRFGNCQINLSTRELHCAGELATLSPKVFDCLAYLIEHRDRAVGRDELIAAVWGKVDVTDTLLGQTVLKARRAIGDTGNEQHAIRTIPRFGYRWVAELQVGEAAVSAVAAAFTVLPTAPLAETIAESIATPLHGRLELSLPSPVNAIPRWRPSRFSAIALSLSVAAIAAIGVWQLGPQRETADTLSTAPLPLPAASDSNDVTAVLPVDVSNQGDGSWLRLGLMDLVASRLRSAGLPVIPSDNVVALTRVGNGSRDAVAKAVTDGTGARLIVLPAASRTATGWVVHLILRGADGRTREVEAHDVDAIKAGRAATDRLLALLGKRAPVESGESGDLSTNELLSRAEAAFLIDDLPAARRLLESAPQAMQQSPELRLRLAQIDFRAGQLDAARERLDALLLEVGAESDPVLRARILNGLGVVDIISGRYVESERGFAESIALLGTRNEPAALGAAYTGHAISDAAQGRYEPALADFSRARVALELAGDLLALARVEANEGIVAAKRGRYAEATVTQERAVQRFERFGALNELAVTLANIVGDRLILLQPTEALATADRAWSLIGRLENQSTQHEVQIKRAQALAANGRLSEASALLAGLAAGTPQLPNVPRLARIHLEQARLDIANGQFATAAALASKAVIALDSDDYQRERATAWVILARALRAQGQDAEASEQTDRLQAWAKTLRGPPANIYAVLADAERLWTARKREAALATYAKALALAEEAGVPADTSEVVVSYGIRLIADGELDRASAIVGQVARWTDRDFKSALLQVRYYRAIGERDAWQAALTRARGLAGELPIPSLLSEPPDTRPTFNHGSR